jgi:hypothetical protein
MFNFVNKCYNSLIKKVDFLKKAEDFRIKELKINEGRIRSRYNDYLGMLAILENKANLELKNIDELKKDVNSRYWSNIYRFFLGGKLIQDIEERIGLEYMFDDYSSFKVVDENKYVTAKRNLEALLEKTEVHDDLKPYLSNNGFDNKLKTYEESKQSNKSSNQSIVKSKQSVANASTSSKTSVESSRNSKTHVENSSSTSVTSSKSSSTKSAEYLGKMNGNGCAGYAGNKKSLEKEVNTYNHTSLKKSSVSALYISSFRDDCFTNKIANVSASYQGVGRDVANILASYVKSDSSELVSPHKRSWKSRVDNLENAILNNNFSSKDGEALKEIKDALSKNTYLVNKKSDLYEKAVSLIDSAIRRGSNCGA